MENPTVDLKISFPELFQPTVTATQLAPVLGTSKSSIYTAIRDNTFPFPVIRIGERIVIPTAPIREALGINHETPAA